MMAEMSNLDSFFEAQFQAVSNQFEESDPEYETSCLKLLADPKLPLYRRVTCCYMMAHISQHSEFYLSQGFDTLQKIETMIEQGRIGDRLKPWTVRVRDRLDELKATMASTAEEGTEIQTAGEVEPSENKADDEAELSENKPADEGKESEKKVIGEPKTTEESSTTRDPPSSVLQSEAPSELRDRVAETTISTDPTSFAPPDIVETPSSPILHPAVREMEDAEDMLFGDHTEYEYMTPEEQAEYDASAGERLRERMRRDAEEGDADDR